MNTTYILIGVSFLLNLIVVLAFRAADKKDRSLKNLNQQVKNFRFETTSFMNRFTEISRDCEQNITSRIEYANTVQNHLAESIDMVLVHQKELDELSGVCENYGNALKKLKAQTEQAENRVYAVQAEVRKTEAVKDYAAQFQKDIDRLTAQLDSLKADYVRLVASTEQDLKATSASQKEENREMLDQFAAALERSKSQLSDYVALEKRGYDDMCRQQEDQAQAQLDALDAKTREIEERISSSEESLGAFAEKLSLSVTDLGERRDLIFGEIDERARNLSSDFEKTASLMEEKREALFSSLDQKLLSTEEKVEEATSAFLTRLEEKVSEMERIAGERGEELEKTLSLSLSSLRSAASASIGEMDEFVKKTSEEMKRTWTEASAEVEKTTAEAVENISRTSSSSIASMNKASQDAIDDLDGAIKSTEDTLEAKLNDKEDEVNASIVSYQEKLQENEKAVEERIHDLRATLDDVLEEIRRALKAQHDDTEKTIRELMDEKEQASLAIREMMDERKREVECTLSLLKADRDALMSQFDSFVEEKKASFSASALRLEDDRSAYVQRCRESLRDALDDADRSSTLLLQRIKDSSESFLKGVADRMVASEKAQKVLEETAYGKIREAEDILNDYGNKIRESEASLNDKVEQVTSMKENIWNLQQEEKALQDEIDQLGQDRDKLQNEAREVRSQRLNEEANLVRLKGQQNVIREKRKNEKKDEKPRHSIEEMDIIIGEEEVDVSDDD